MPMNTQGNYVDFFSREKSYARRTQIGARSKMENLHALFKEASHHYNRSLPHQNICKNIITHAHQKLFGESDYAYYGNFQGNPQIPYHVFGKNDMESRPIRPDIFIEDSRDLLESYDFLIMRLRAGPARWYAADMMLANKVVYTSVMSVACCYDLWKRGSRKTPGTFFEVMMAGLLQEALPLVTFTKHIPLTNLLPDDGTADRIGEAADEEEEQQQGSSVATDLVIGSSTSPVRVVVPLKITTRERIVQPFAHQRILESAFPGRYQSHLACMSETQLDSKTHAVKQVCVPGPVKLYQRFLAPLSGLYYCDPPQRYMAPDMQAVLPVRTIGEFFPEIARILSV